MSVLAVSGDIGGGKAVLAVLAELSSRNQRFSIVENGFLAKESPAVWDRIPANLQVISEIFASGKIRVLIFSSSIKDSLALQIARIAKQQEVYTIFLLDNWMNYGQRLEIDGEEMFLPDKYLVMDELAFEEGCADGIDSGVLEVAGQPALAELGCQFEKWDKENKRVEFFEKFSFDPKKKLLAFISEPAEADHGADGSNPLFRGYTEKVVLEKLCSILEPFADKYQIAVIPHPREDVEVLSEQWKDCSGKLQGRILELSSGREAVFLADGIAGMCSILLYEAWLLNKPVISIQPGLCKSHLDIMQKREGVYCIVDEVQWSETLDDWLGEVNCLISKKETRKELELHIQAPKLIANIIADCLKAS